MGEKLDVAKQEFLKMQELGIIRPSSSPWASPFMWFRRRMAAGGPAGIIED